MGSPFANEVHQVFEEAKNLYFKLEERLGAEVAQYAVPFDFIQSWFISISAREIYWMGELRTGPQARSHYKQVVLDIVDEASKKDPSVFRGLLADRNDYRLARRESEIRIERKQI